MALTADQTVTELENREWSAIRTPGGWIIKNSRGEHIKRAPMAVMSDAVEAAITVSDANDRTGLRLRRKAFLVELEKGIHPRPNTRPDGLDPPGIETYWTLHAVDGSQVGIDEHATAWLALEALSA